MKQDNREIKKILSFFGIGKKMSLGDWFNYSKIKWQNVPLHSPSDILFDYEWEVIKSNLSL